MTRTQIQLPEPLFQRLRHIAEMRDVSLAELIRRGMETYAQSFPELEEEEEAWTMPVLRGSGGHLTNPALVKPEAEAIERRSTRN